MRAKQHVARVHLQQLIFVAVYLTVSQSTAFSDLMLLVGRQEGHPACKITEWWGDAWFCLERGADLHMAQLMPLPLTVSCFSKIQIGFTFLVPAYPGSPGQRAVKWVCVYLTFSQSTAFSALTLLAGRQEEQPACEN